MHPYTWKSPKGNVGDDLNSWLWNRLIPNLQEIEGDATLVGIGSILDGRFNGSPGKKIVFGAGARSDNSLPDLKEQVWDVRFVRGPCTAKALGLDDTSWISDPAILAPLAYPATGGVASDGEVRRLGFVPYFKTPEVYAALIAQLVGAELIPVTLSPENFIDQIVQCDAVIAESMHGAILSDAYGVPWVGCKASSGWNEGEVNSFKWNDWARSLNMHVSQIELPMYWSREEFGQIHMVKLMLKSLKARNVLKRAIGKNPWQLSDRDLLRERQDQIMRKISELTPSA